MRKLKLSIKNQSITFSTNYRHSAKRINIRAAETEQPICSSKTVEKPVEPPASTAGTKLRGARTAKDETTGCKIALAILQNSCKPEKPAPGKSAEKSIDLVSSMVSDNEPNCNNNSDGKAMHANV